MATETTKSFIGDMLGSIVFSGVPSNAAYDVLKLAWRKLRHQSILEIYVSALHKALDSEREILDRYRTNDGDLVVNEQAMRRILNEEIAYVSGISVYGQLVADELLDRLATRMHERNVLVIGGNNLAAEGYAQIIRNLVRHAREVFREGIRKDVESLNHVLLECAEETLGNTKKALALLEELDRYLDSRFELVLAKLEQQSKLLGSIRVGVDLLVQQKQQVLESPHGTKRSIRVFTCCPEDVSDECSIAMQICERIRLDPILNMYITIEAFADVERGAAVQPMGSVITTGHTISSLPRPSACDIVVIVLWTRMGQILHDMQETLNRSAASHTEWVYEDALHAARRNRGYPRTLIYLCKSDPTISMRDPQIEQKRLQLQLVDAFMDRVRMDSGNDPQPYNIYDSQDIFRQQLENHLRILISEMVRNDSSTVLGTLLPGSDEHVQLETVWEGSPFPGLRPFTDKDAPIFFGRGKQTDELVRLIKSKRMVVVVGASGSGKSSLVWAGVIPRVNDKWFVVRFTPGETGNNPFVPLAVHLIAQLGLGEWTSRSLIAHSSNDPRSLYKLLDSRVSHERELLLFIDQFEELFTISSDEWRKEFIEMLTEVESSEKVRIIITLRSDFYPECLAWPTLTAMMEKGHFPVSTPQIGSLFDMITRPALLVGLDIEPNLVQRMLDDTGNEPGALALLAYTLDELYRMCHQSGQMSLAHYDSLRGIQGAIGRRAEDTFATLGSITQNAFADVFRELADVDIRGTATRRRAHMRDIAISDGGKAFIEAFINARLLVADGDGDDIVVQVAHEAIFRNWDRLSAWIDRMQADLFLLRQMRIAALQWDQHGRRRDFLWLGELGLELQGMLARLRPQLSITEREFAKPEVLHLLDEIADDRTTPVRRSVIGERLSTLGDKRQGVSLRSDGLPDIVWCYVPDGDVVIENRAFVVGAFYIAKFLVTYEQFQSFVKSERGLKSSEWWIGFPEEYRGKPVEQQSNKHSNHPREKVSWYQAVAFCRWLTAEYRSSVHSLSSPRLASDSIDWSSDDWVIRLPSEWEWVQAATGGEKDYKYPWGVDWRDNCANTSEAVIGKSSAVGMFPSGASKVGALDMSGNVWEWCLNEYRSLSSAIVDFESEAARTLRGGSFSRDKTDAMITARNFDDPFFSYPSFGFRVCAARLL